MPGASRHVESSLFATMLATRGSRARGLGFTLLELMLGVGIVAILAAIAIPGYRAVYERSDVNKAVQDLGAIAAEIERFRSIRLQLPDSLTELSNIPPADPWGHPYQYLNFDGASNGKIRKDHNLHPLNTEFDLYSKGPDGASVPPLTASPSRDDIIWAKDGTFVGKAADF
jgi:general secretion pathway protein G